MTLVCPPSIDTRQLRTEISNIYGRVARNPDDSFHFHRGPAYAADFLGYDAAELALLPGKATASFAGVGNPHLMAAAKPGETVLDIGCGAGMDLLLAARKVGPTGSAIGIDMTEHMIECALEAAHEAGLGNVDVCKGDATSLPVPDASVDLVISNGVLNLVPEKEKAFQEIMRVLRPGGRLQVADIVVEAELSEDIRQDIDLWTGWIAGALPEAELVEVLAGLGLSEVRVTHRFECFRGTSKEGVAKKLGVRGANVFGRKAARLGG